VLSIIFLLILPSDSLELGEEWRLPLSQQTLQGRNPLLLCAACSLWRTFALATPQLWRQIRIHIPQGISEAIARSKADHLLQWIQRSGSLPLALYISSEKFFSQGRESIRVASIISVLQHHATRCRALYLQKPSDNVLLEIFNAGRSPLKRQVRQPMPQWVQLTHLQIRGWISHQQAFVIFRACSKLAWLSINFRLSRASAHLCKPPIILHDLVSIFLGSKSGCLSVVMKLISAPSLREMCVATTGTTSRDGESLVHFLTRSSCTLDRLDLGGTFVSRDIIPLLAHRCCSSLTSLIIRDFPGLRYSYPIVNDEILQRLDLHRGDSLCPHLNLLGLRRISGSHSAVQSMIESRIYPQACPTLHERLQYFHLQWVEILDFDPKRLDEILKRSEMAYSLDLWDNRCGSASGWPQGEAYSDIYHRTGES
jgi:hypothetical protein